jgi:hypothetical protein
VTLLSIPITRLPAILGRSHETSDPHFFGLGMKKVLSRNQAVLQWRDHKGGQLVPTSSSSSNSWVYQPPQTTTATSSSSPSLKIIGIESLEQLPETG